MQTTQLPAIELEFREGSSDKVYQEALRKRYNRYKAAANPEYKPRKVPMCRFYRIHLTVNRFNFDQNERFNWPAIASGSSYRIAFAGTARH